MAGQPTGSCCTTGTVTVRADVRTNGALSPLGSVALGLALLACTSLLASCSSSPSTQVSKQAIQNACQQVSTVLSDGPDPDADPVGYAEAQVRPLRQVHTADARLQGLIDNLASAYESFFNTDGSSSAKKQVTSAGNAIDVICPGAV